MRDRIPTDYGELLRLLAASGALTPAERDRVTRLLRDGGRDALAFAAHELAREMTRDGRLLLRRGRLDRIGTALVVSDERRGRVFSLSPLLTRRTPFMRPPLAAATGALAAFDSREIALLIRHESLVTRASVERSADLKAIVMGILDLTREFLDVPAALFFTRTLEIPNGMARGPRDLVLGPRTASVTAGASGPPPAWAAWVSEAGQASDHALYLPDFSKLAASQRPLSAGSALLVGMSAPDPAWEGVLVAIAPAPFWFDSARLARLRMLVPYFTTQLTHAGRLQKAISVDGLTGVYNRSFLNEQLARMLEAARRRDQQFALLIADIDDFRGFNSRHGYDGGDQILRAVAQRMAAVLRRIDVLARYGGEEFVALLAPDLSRDEALQIGERLRSAVAEVEIEIPSLDGTRARGRVTVSIGGALFPRDGHTRDELWRQANRMLREVKTAGKNAVRIA